MTQSQLDRAVASATGESRRTIRQLGFSLAGPLSRSGERRGGDVAKFLDWDHVDRSRFHELAVF
jgi:hypothetical protein